MSPQLTLYTSKACPYAHRVEIALAEAGAEFTRYEIDLTNKPDWYAPKVNPASKVPSIAYGGPEVPPDQPSPESTKLVESLVLVDFVADLYPDCGLLPKDPVQRAKARIFIDAVQNKFIPTIYAVVTNGETEKVEDMVKALEHLQGLLPPEGFAIGEYSVADVSITSFLARLEMNLENDLGGFPAGKGEGPRILALLRQPKLARFQKYWRDAVSRPSSIATFDRDLVLERYTNHFNKIRAKKYGA